MTIQEVTDILNPDGQKMVLLFWAPWHEGSAGPMTQMLEALEQSTTNIFFGRVQAEQYPMISSKFAITMVPTLVFLDESGSIVERMEGVDDVAEVTQAVARLQEMTSPSYDTSKKGSSSSASSTSTTQPTPQELSSEERLTKRLELLIRSSEVMLFMKGTPTAPKCGFSRQIVELLQEDKIPFASFDILSDEEVRQGLKKHSNWPTYPQLYVKGDLMGGLDIVKEMKDDGGDTSLREQILGHEAATAETTETLSLEDRLKKLTNRSNVMLFMKGLPSAPKCGFSRQIVEILDQQEVAYDAFDILQDNEVREGLKKYSDWPAYPQLYVSGDLVGGLDIIKEMREDGSLAEILSTPS